MVAIMGTAMDVDGPLQEVQLKIEDSEWMNAVGTDNWVYNWDTNMVPNGNYVITVRAYDGVLYSDEVTINLNVEHYVGPNMKPIVTIISPKNGAVLKGTVNVFGTTFDYDGIVAKVEIRIVKTTEVDSNISWEEVKGTNKWSYQWDTTEVDDGNYYIYVRAFDGRNHSNTPHITLEVDNVANVEVEVENNLTPANNEGLSSLHIILIIIIIIVIILGVFGVMRKRRYKEEDEPEVEKVQQPQGPYSDGQHSQVYDSSPYGSAEYGRDTRQQPLTYDESSQYKQGAPLYSNVPKPYTGAPPYAQGPTPQPIQVHMPSQKEQYKNIYGPPKPQIPQQELLSLPTQVTQAPPTRKICGTVVQGSKAEGGV